MYSECHSILPLGVVSKAVSVQRCPRPPSAATKWASGHSTQRPLNQPTPTLGTQEMLAPGDTGRALYRSELTRRTGEFGTSYAGGAMCRGAAHPVSKAVAVQRCWRPKQAPELRRRSGEVIEMLLIGGAFGVCRRIGIISLRCGQRGSRLTEAARDSYSQASERLRLQPGVIRGRSRRAPNLHGFGGARRAEHQPAEPRADRSHFEHHPFTLDPRRRRGRIAASTSKADYQARQEVNVGSSRTDFQPAVITLVITVTLGS